MKLRSVVFCIRPIYIGLTVCEWTGLCLGVILLGISVFLFYPTLGLLTSK